MTQKIILLTSSTGRALDRVTEALGPSASIAVVRDLESLRAAPVDRDTSLICFGTGVIVPGDLLASLTKPAYNLHAASPEFPGRDPHHFAIYRSAQRYGATLHLMTERVDDGATVAVEMFDVKPDATPDSLLAEANRAALRLIERCGARMLERKPMRALPDVRWGPIKTRRSDFLQLCRVNALTTSQEFELRRRACASTSHSNLTVELHGQIFKIDRAAAIDDGLGEFSEFTEAGFQNILRQLKSAGYRFARYGDQSSGSHVIWRHDVDVSMNRAVRLAEIEHQEGVVSTYFINPRSCFYSIFEPETEAMLRRIQSLGHEIGLHFDASAYATRTWSEDALSAAVRREQALLETLLQSPIRALSWHNPDQSNLLDFQDSEIAGLSNAYSGTLRRDYVYCSDSNGYWRFKPMGEVIAMGHERLHLLTHPDWWTPDAMSPSERITRALLGRARRLRDDYDRRLALAGRRNAGGK